MFNRFFAGSFYYKTRHPKYLLECFTLKYFSILIAILVLAIAIKAQDDRLLNNKVLDCDESVALQDIAIMKALEKLTKDSVLFVVVTQGTEENSVSLKQKRLYNVQQYFRDRGNSLPSEKIIVVESQPVSKYGRLEFYINGQIYLRLIYPKNGYICHSCCLPDDSYYPNKGKYKNQKGKKQG